MIREVARTKTYDDELDLVPWQLSLYAGPDRVALGWHVERHPTEWTAELYLGPFSLLLWRKRKQ